MPNKNKEKTQTAGKPASENSQHGGQRSDIVGGVAQQPATNNDMNYRFPVPVCSQQGSPTYINPLPPPFPQTFPQFNSGFIPPVPTNTQIHQVGMNETTVAQPSQAMMYDFMQQMNQRMMQIQDSVSKLGDIQKDMATMHKNASRLERDNNEIKGKLNSFETFSETVGNFCDDYFDTKKELTEELSCLRQENRKLNAEIDSMKDVNKNLLDDSRKLNESFLDMKMRAMETNLIFFGIEEEEEYGKTEGVLKEFLKSEITLPENKNADDIAFQKVHRIGRKKSEKELNNQQDKPRPRPIVAQFEKFNDRESVRNAATTITNTKFSVREHFPIEIEERRRKLYPIMRIAAKNENRKVRLVRDKLYIDNVLYDENDPEFGYLRKPLKQKIDNPRNFGYQHTPINRGNRTQREQSELPHTDRLSYSQSYDMNSRKYVRAERVRLNPRNPVDITTNNRFNYLQDNSIEECQTQAFGKKKATSPLTDDRDYKKSREDSKIGKNETANSREIPQNNDTEEPSEAHEYDSIVTEAEVHCDNKQLEMETEAQIIETPLSHNAESDNNN